MIQSSIVATGYLPRCLPQLHEHGVDLPPVVYEAAERAGRGRPPNTHG